jgi:hypothetical protein
MVPEPNDPLLVNLKKEDVSMTNSPMTGEGEESVAAATTSNEAKPIEPATSGGASSKMEVDAKPSPTVTTTNPAPKMEVGSSTNVRDGLENIPGLPETGRESLNFNGPNDFDLSLDFGNDDIENQNFLAGTNFLDSSTAAATITGDGMENQGSISSLLRGLESYATHPTDDQFNFDFNRLSADASRQQPINDQRNNSQDDMALHGESSFDDLFMEKDNFGGDGEDSLLGDSMDLGDSWFK